MKFPVIVTSNGGCTQSCESYADLAEFLKTFLDDGVSGIEAIVDADGMEYAAEWSLEVVEL